MYVCVYCVCACMEVFMRVRSFMCVHSFVLFVVVCSFPKQLVLNCPILMFSPCERIARSEIDGSGFLHRFVSPAPRTRLFFSHVFKDYVYRRVLERVCLAAREVAQRAPAGAGLTHELQ